MTNQKSKTLLFLKTAFTTGSCHHTHKFEWTNSLPLIGLLFYSVTTFYHCTRQMSALGLVRMQVESQKCNISRSCSKALVNGFSINLERNLKFHLADVTIVYHGLLQSVARFRFCGNGGKIRPVTNGAGLPHSVWHWHASCCTLPRANNSGPVTKAFSG